jgi:ribonuclease HI
MHHPGERLWDCYNEGSYVLIATDGACSNNGRADAVAGCGVYWGLNNNHNASFQLDDGVHPTSQRAELSAAIYALRKFRNILANGGYKNSGYIDYVVIKTDSAYVVNSMTDWIIKWRDNGFTNQRGFRVVNEDLFRELDDLCYDIEDLGCQACFWQVPREENTDADQLTRNAIY